MQFHGQGVIMLCVMLLCHVVVFFFQIVFCFSMILCVLFSDLFCFCLFFSTPALCACFGLGACAFTRVSMRFFPFALCSV